MGAHRGITRHVIREGDARDLSFLGDTSVHLVCTSPPYGALKAFAADVLTALPHAGLEDLQLLRDSAGSTELESVVRFTLIYRGA